MAITARAEGTWAVITADATVAIPVGATTGDRMFLLAAWKPFGTTAQVVTPAGWTELTEFADGSVANGNGVGSVKVACYYKTHTGSESNPSLDFSANPDVAAAVIIVFQKAAAETWENPTFATAAMTNWTTTSQTVTASSNPGIRGGDLVVGLIGIRDDSATMTRPTSGINATGITWTGNYVEYPSGHFTTTTGFDLSGDAGYRIASSGAASAAPTMTGTISAAETGAALWIIQGTTTPGYGQAQAHIKSTTRSYGQAQARIFAPAREYAQAAADINANNNFKLRQQAANCQAGEGTQLNIGIMPPAENSILIMLSPSDVPTGITGVTGGGRIWTKVQDLVNVNIGTEIWITTNSTDASGVDNVRLTFNTSDSYCAEVYEITNAQRASIGVSEFADTDSSLFPGGISFGTHGYEVFAVVVNVIDEATGLFESYSEDYVAGLLHNNQHGLATKSTGYKFYSAGQPTDLAPSLNYNSTPSDFVSAILYIRQTPMEVGQAQALIGAPATYVHGQTQAQIKQIYVPTGQTQAQLKQTYRGFGQTQAWIESTSFGLGQAQGRILTTYFALGQANVDIKQTYTPSGQAQAQVKQVYNQTGQTNASIKQTYPLCVGESSEGNLLGQFILGQDSLGAGPSEFICVGAFGQAQAEIEIAVVPKYVHGQSQAQIKQTYTQSGQSQAHIVVRDNNAYGQSASIVLSTYYGTGQSQAQIKQTYQGVGQAQATIQGNVHGQAQADIKQSYISSGQSQADILNTYYISGQAQARIKRTYGEFGQVQAKIISFGVNAFGQAQANISFSGNVVHGQAQAKVNAFDYNQSGQAQAQIILLNRNTYGQTQAVIKNTYHSFGQANVLIVTTADATGQASGWIKTTYTITAQTQGQILQKYTVSAQSQAVVKNTYQATGQSQAYIILLKQGYGQAQSLLKTSYKAFGQAAAIIRNSYDAYGNAQSTIKVTVNSCGQSQALIGAKSSVHGQAQAYIISERFVVGQAQAFIFRQELFGQAQAFIVTVHTLDRVELDDDRITVITIEDDLVELEIGVVDDLAEINISDDRVIIVTLD